MEEGQVEEAEVVVVRDLLEAEDSRAGAAEELHIRLA
jgi:hypothetical protein